MGCGDVLEASLDLGEIEVFPIGRQGMGIRRSDRFFIAVCGVSIHLCPTVARIRHVRIGFRLFVKNFAAQPK
jgi:hypothetical protein